MAMWGIGFHHCCGALNWLGENSRGVLSPIGGSSLPRARELSSHVASMIRLIQAKVDGRGTFRLNAKVPQSPPPNQLQFIISTSSLQLHSSSQFPEASFIRPARFNLVGRLHFHPGPATGSFDRRPDNFPLHSPDRRYTRDSDSSGRNPTSSYFPIFPGSASSCLRASFLPAPTSSRWSATMNGSRPSRNWRRSAGARRRSASRMAGRVSTRCWSRTKVSLSRHQALGAEEYDAIWQELSADMLG